MLYIWKLVIKMVKYIIMEYKWISHPFIDYPLKTVLFVTVLIIIGIFVYYIFQAGFYVILYAIFFFLTFMGYWFPTFYVVNDKSISIKRLFMKVEKEWKDYKKVYVDDKGFFLSPFKEKNVLMKTRGIYVICHVPEREAIIEFVKKMVQSDE